MENCLGLVLSSIVPVRPSISASKTLAVYLECLAGKATAKDIRLLVSISHLFAYLLLYGVPDVFEFM